MVIKALDNALINKIAAGEVIERPSSVVKELLENALDAGADEIKIEIENSGLNRIRVSDNGSGMDRTDLLISYKRHTTSKISNEDDLFNINSLGFRGEALASISEVSNVKIKTKKKEDLAGNMIEVEGGILLSNQKIGCSDGTIIEVSNLFYNVPARKKFLKSNEVELSYIIDIITKYALIKNEISIRLFNNNQEIINSQKTDSLLNNIIFIYGAEVGKNLLEIDYKENGIHVYGYTSKPNLTRATKSDQSIYVNSRYVKDKIISNAIYDAYKTLLFVNRHPIFILNVNIENKDIDVNVHPSKELIRIKEEEKVSEIIKTAIEETLFSNQSLIVESDLETSTYKEPTKIYQIQKEQQSNLFKSSKEYKIKENTIVVKDENKHSFADFNILGQINKTFIICESNEGLILIDQHAAEERVNYEKFMENKKNNTIKKQKLLDKRIIELSPGQKQVAINNKQFLESLGFEFEDFGGNNVKISSIPEIFGKLKTTIFIDILNELHTTKIQSINKEIEDKIIKFACRASVKAGDELTKYEIKILLKNLEECSNPFSCPHGRPTIIKISIADLEKKFKRTGW